MTDPQTRLSIDISIQDERWSSAVSDVEAVCQQSARAAFDGAEPSCPLAELSMVLADNDFVADLNLRYREREGPTNVLSFAALDDDDVQIDLPDGVPLMLGDVIIAYDVCVAEADVMGISLEHHLRHLVVHGTLHVLGFDHIDDEDAAEMEPLETKILQSMGVSDPYAT